VSSLVPLLNLCAVLLAADRELRSVCLQMISLRGEFVML
jgi:hypothetical protein